MTVLIGDARARNVTLDTRDNVSGEQSSFALSVEGRAKRKGEMKSVYTESSLSSEKARFPFPAANSREISRNSRNKVEAITRDTFCRLETGLLLDISLRYSRTISAYCVTCERANNSELLISPDDA